MPEYNVVITRVGPDMVESFWTGKSWSFEYPDAKLYIVGVAHRVAVQFNGDCQLIADYGLDTQTTIE